jgi:hypothetical protein
MKTMQNIFFGVLAYVIVALFSGQVLMHGQGDTLQISFRYGLLYVVNGGGITDVFHYLRLGEFHFLPALVALIQLLVAVGVFCAYQFRKPESTVVAHHTPDGICRPADGSLKS